MMDLVKDEDSVDVIIHVGTKHLSGSTTVYIPKLNASEKCSIDFTAMGRSDNDTFDPWGRFIGGATSTLLAPCNVRLEAAESASTLAYVNNVDLPSLGVRSGTNMFINPNSRQVLGGRLLMPFKSDHVVQKGDSLGHFHGLPVILFHEFTHTVLAGKHDARCTFAACS